MLTHPAAPAVVQCGAPRTRIKILDDLSEGYNSSGRKRELGLGAVYGRSFAAARLCGMELITILNRCHRFRGFVYQHAQ